MEKIKICMSIDWDKKTQKIEKIKISDQDIYMNINIFDPDALFFCDIGGVFLELNKKAPCSKRVFVATEPSPVMNMNEELAHKISEYYKRNILAWHKPLQKYAQTINYMCPLCFVQNYPDQSNKIFGISGFFGNKNNLGFSGYPIRRKILEHQDKINIPSIIWNFSKKWKGKNIQYPLPRKIDGMNYMFHFAIENHKEQGYFTEKIIDCFRTYSIPIYYGDPNISKFFNPNGIIFFEENNWIEIINNLTPQFYKEKQKYILENHHLAGEYIKNDKLISILIKRGIM